MEEQLKASTTIMEMKTTQDELKTKMKVRILRKNAVKIWKNKRIEGSSLDMEEVCMELENFKTQSRAHNTDVE